MRRCRLAAIGLALVLALASLPTLLSAAAPASAQGPRWWRVSNGGQSTLWILGIPDGMMMDAKWDDSSLRLRLSSARLLISPLLGEALSEPDPHWTAGGWEDSSLATKPGEQLRQEGPIAWTWNNTLGRYAQLFSDPASKRLPPEMMQRLQKALPSLSPDLRTRMMNAKTWELAVWLDVWNWPSGLLGNPVTTRAQRVAKSRGLAVDLVYVPALWKPTLMDPAPLPPGTERWADFDWIDMIRPNIKVEPPEPIQQKCLANVLEQTESGRMPALRRSATEAWAAGDVDRALKRSNNVQLCLLGDLPSTGLRAFEIRQAATYIDRLDHAFDEPGETVALVEFDSLLLSEVGVLAHYRSQGYDISAGNLF